MNAKLERTLRTMTERGRDPGAAAIWQRAVNDASPRRRRRRRMLIVSTTTLAIALLIAVVPLMRSSSDKHVVVGPASATIASGPAAPSRTPTSLATLNPSAARSTTVPATSPPPSSTLPATTTTTGVPSAQALLLALQSDRFDGSSLPAHLHALGVGRWQYADAGHVGSGYVGSAQVRLRSDAMGESISSTYDVFMAAPAAAASFTRAYSNFRTYGPAGSVRIPQLNPSVNAFCAPQAAPPDTTTCWFVRGLTTGIVTATTPSSTSRGDEDAVLQAMLTHLVALGG